MAKAFKENPDLMERLEAAQCHEANDNIDIMTWAAFCETREELERHVLRYEQRAAQYVTPKR